MTIDAFKFEEDIYEGYLFTNAFLRSPDFVDETIKDIANAIHIPSGIKRKSGRIDKVSADIEKYPRRQLIIMQYYLTRQKKWFTFKKYQENFSAPQLLNPAELVISPGIEEWYGPLLRPDDRSALWYIRPFFNEHWEIPMNETRPKKYMVRWMCAARFCDNIVSLHWNGFTYSQTLESVRKHNSQFPFWIYVPNLFEELKKKFKIKLEEINLPLLVLHILWDNYRYNENFRWIDRGFRAEAGGVALSARAGGVVEISTEEMRGIRRLANSLRQAVAYELKTTFNSVLPEPERFDEVILRTLLREFGTLSYEFSLEDKSGEQIFRANNYLGAKPRSQTQDCFPHLKIYTTRHSDLNQLNFLVKHLKHLDDNKNKFEQGRLF